MAQPACGTDRINSFAAVSYIPGALGDFLTRLRQELVSGCIARSHVSLLPPRALCGGLQEAESFFAQSVAEFHSFHVELSEVETFDETLVVFLALSRGASEIRAMHERLNRGPLSFLEPYPFHPHVTLAQGLPREQFREVRDIASRRWAECRLGRSVLIENATFVQNTLSNCWLDLLDCRLRLTPESLVR